MTEAEMYESGLHVLLGAMSSEDWATRRKVFENWRSLPASPASDPYPSTPRPLGDEFGWYAFVGESVLTDAFTLDPDEVARILPILAGLADRWHCASRVTGLKEKLANLAGALRANPDNGLFEIAVALAYAAQGFDVTLIPEQPGVRKTPDIKASMEDLDVYIECKRQSKFSEYELEERAHWNRLWLPLQALLLEIRNPVWLRIELRCELSSYGDTYLADRLRLALAMTYTETILVDDEFLKVEAKPADLNAVQLHLRNVFMKVRGTQERALLGGHWAPPRANMESVCMGRRMEPSTKVPAWQARSFWDAIYWGCGVTWQCTAEIAIDRKARDIKALFARAIEQLPDDEPGIVHIAAETLAGNDVEVRRTEKIKASLKGFELGKPVLGLMLHRIQSESPPDGAFNFDESVSDFWLKDGLSKVLPRFVFIPRSTVTRKGGHWDHY